MAEAAAEFIGLRLIPIVRQFDHAMLRLLAIAHEGQRVLLIGTIGGADQAHAHHLGVKVDGALEVANAQHGVQQSHGAWGSRSSGLESSNERGACG